MMPPSEQQIEEAAIRLLTQRYGPEYFRRETAEQEWKWALGQVRHLMNRRRRQDD